MLEDYRQEKLEDMYAKMVDLYGYIEDEDERQSLKYVIFKLGKHIVKTYYEENDDK